MTNRQKLIWRKKLIKYWMLRDKAETKFRKYELELEKKMKEELGEELEFFYGDMHEGCFGIGHSDYNRRDSKKPNHFPLFTENFLTKEGGNLPPTLPEE